MVLVIIKFFLGFLLQKAALLGYDSHAAFVLDMRMAKTPQRVDTFLTELSTKLAPLQQEEMKLFLDYKKEEVSLLAFRLLMSYIL